MQLTRTKPIYMLEPSLARCLDPVAGASRVLMSVDAGARVRGLEVLRA
eukprot:COSAG05_NODE_26213_length_190_cov_23.241758_1_plen_47_part_10